MIDISNTTLRKFVDAGILPKYWAAGTIPRYRKKGVLAL